MRLARLLVGWIPLDPRGRRATGEVLADWHHEAALAVSGLTRFGVAVRALAALARTLAFVTVVERLPGTGGAGSRPPGTGDAGRRPPRIGAVPQDLRYAIRTLAKAPVFTTVVVLSLGLGIGATSTIFSAMNPIMLRPLPFPDPDRLVIISERGEVSAQQPDRRRGPAYSTVLEWQEHSSTFDHLEFVFDVTWEMDYPGVAGAERYGVQWVTPGFFRMLGVDPILGRGFGAEVSPPHGDGAVMLSYGFWQRRFGGDPGIIGQTWANEGVVVGVMPPGFQIFSWNETDFWPLMDTDFSDDTRIAAPIGRLAPGLSMADAEAELDGIARSLDQSGVSAESGWHVRVAPLHEWVADLYVGNLYLLMGAAVLLLLIACSNVANLLVGRATYRHREFVTRAALGAGRLRLMRQMLTESIVLALSGGTLGVLMALVGTRLFVILAPDWYLPAEEIRVDGMVLGFTLGLSLLTVVLFGMAPALRASKPDLAGSLNTGARGSTGGSRPLVRKLMVASQIALTFVLLAGAALMINSLVRLVTVDRGFDPEPLLTARIQLQGDRFRSRVRPGPHVVTPAVEAFYRELLDRLRVLPGVEAAEMVSGGGQASFTLLPGPALPRSEAPREDYREASPGFFRAMGVPLLRGRFFTARDTGSSPWVAIISESMARQYFPDEDPLGKFLHADLTPPDPRFTTPSSADRPREIVGIVADISQDQRRGKVPTIYVPPTQHPTEYAAQVGVHANKQLVLRTTLDPASFAVDVRGIVADLDPGVVVSDVETMPAKLDRTVTKERFWMRTLGIFATLALVLAVVGIYGVASYAVAQRTREIGVRMALGAQQTDVLKMFIRQGMVMTAAGVSIGVLGAVAATRLLQRWLYEIEPTDPATFATVAVALVGIALLATWVPARGATRVDPVNTMRNE